MQCVHTRVLCAVGDNGKCLYAYVVSWVCAFCVLICRCVQSALGEAGVCTVCTGRRMHTHVFGAGGCVYPHCQSVCGRKGAFRASSKC